MKNGPDLEIWSDFSVWVSSDSGWSRVLSSGPKSGEIRLKSDRIRRDLARSSEIRPKFERIRRYLARFVEILPRFH